MTSPSFHMTCDKYDKNTIVHRRKSCTYDLDWVHLWYKKKHAEWFVIFTISVMTTEIGTPRISNKFKIMKTINPPLFSLKTEIPPFSEVNSSQLYICHHSVQPRDLQRLHMHWWPAVKIKGMKRSCQPLTLSFQSTTQSKLQSTPALWNVICCWWWAIIGNGSPRETETFRLCSKTIIYKTYRK